jgi:hypothetical protein
MKFKYEIETKTIRTVPENYCLMSFNTFVDGGSFDAALLEKQESIACLISAAPEMVEALELVFAAIFQRKGSLAPQNEIARKVVYALAKARGKT